MTFSALLLNISVWSNKLVFHSLGCRSVIMRCIMIWENILNKTTASILFQSDGQQITKRIGQQMTRECQGCHLVTRRKGLMCRP